MGWSRRQASVVAAVGFASAGLVVSAIIRRAAGGAPAPDPSREAFLDERRARMQTARGALVTPPDRRT